MVLLETGLRAGGSLLLSAQEHRNRQSIKQKGSYRIMCLGESTTRDQYPPFFEAALNQSKAGVTFSVIDKGAGGVNTDTIVAQLESNLKKYDPDMVVAMMGINDGGAHMPYEAATSSKAVLFLRSFRTYKLARFLWLRIMVKARAAGSTSVLSSATEAALKRAIERNPEDDKAYIDLGRCYRKRGDLSRAEAAFKKAIALNPQNDHAYVRLGTFYRDRKRSLEAEAAFKRAIELNPGNGSAYAALGWSYQYQGMPSRAEAAFKKAIALNPRNGSACFGLAWCYQSQGKLSLAEDALKKYMAIDPENDSAYGALSLLCEEMGDPGLAREYAQKADSLRQGYYSPATVQNYHKLKAILDKRGVRLACVQYPGRSIEPLKKIFEGGGEGVIFVDNEKIFRDAVKKDGSRVYFNDMFGGDTGHCTDQGNRLLAGNIARVILKEVFDK
jgi:tetratricopeptide (TPR) repeat protein